MIQIDPTSRKPIYDQLMERIEQLILAGVYTADMQLPSVRSLSCSLSVNPNTIQKAYAALCNKGLTYSVSGKGCFVSGNALAVIHQKARERLPEFEKTIGFLLDNGIAPRELKEMIDKAEAERRKLHDSVQ